MTEPLENAINEIVTVVRTVTGILQVPVNPPETINVPVFALVYAESGDIGINAMGQTSLGSVGNRAAFHTVAIDILTTRSDLAVNLAFMKPFVDTVSAALLAQCSPGGGMFNSSITTFGRIHYEWVNPKYAGVQYTGYHFTMNEVKILINAS